MSTTTPTAASINKRVVTGIHKDTGEETLYSGPTGKIVERDGNKVVIETPEGFRCTGYDVMGAVTFHYGEVSA